jgi:hypothetical protein
LREWRFEACVEFSFNDFFALFWIIHSKIKGDLSCRLNSPGPWLRGIMTASNDHFNREGILLHCVIECPVCGEKAHSFRIRRVMNLRTVNGEFYHRTGTCAGSMTPDLPAAMDLLRLAVRRAV